MKQNSKYPVDLTKLTELVKEKLTEKGNSGRIPNWTHISGGAETGSTWRRNLESYKSIGFNMNAINDVKPEEIDLSANMFGVKLKLPIGAAPMSAAINFTCDDAFVELAKGCKEAGIAASVGFPSGSSVHGKMAETGAPTFRLIKPLRDLEKLVDELKKCEAEGCFATGVDIDSAAGLKPAGDEGHFGEITRPLTIAELKKAKDSVKIPFIIKGVLSVKDAMSSMEVGADAIVVSSHAGYAMDYCQAPLEVFPAIKKAIGNKIEMIVDSGIRRGSDIIKAIALGADGILVGRLAIWGLLIGGGEGVAWIMKLLEDEMKRIMTLLGVKSLKELNPDCLVALNKMGEQILK
ncbi:MAG: alpha-hydroxy acid oxidase [Candidatus Humimicrobiaceae bacterium]